MGDSTWVNLTVHPRDWNDPGWRKFLGQAGDSEHDTPGTWYGSECNYALADILEQLADSGVRFYGEHGEGGDYHGCVFFSDGTDATIHYNATGTWDRNYIMVPVIFEPTRCQPDYNELMSQISILQRYRKTVREIENEPVPDLSQETEFIAQPGENP